MAGILEYIRSKFQPICRISHSFSTATHLATAVAAAATDLTAAAYISIFNYTNLQASINYISFMFQVFINLQVSTSTMPAKGKGGHGKGKKTAKPKAVLPSLSSDDDRDDHDEHDDAIPNVPDVPITSTPTIPPESPVEPPSNKSTKMRELTAEEEDDRMAEG